MRVKGNLALSKERLRRCAPVKFIGMATSRTISIWSRSRPASWMKESCPGSVSWLSGATMALVTPFTRVMGISELSAWKASETCMWGMISSLSSTRSLVICSAEISVSPRLVSESMSPG